MNCSKCNTEIDLSSETYQWCGQEAKVCSHCGGYNIWRRSKKEKQGYYEQPCCANCDHSLNVLGVLLCNYGDVLDGDQMLVAPYACCMHYDGRVESPVVAKLKEEIDKMEDDLYESKEGLVRAMMGDDY
jgi:hypothetical protein